MRSSGIPGNYSLTLSPSTSRVPAGRSVVTPVIPVTLNIPSVPTFSTGNPATKSVQSVTGVRTGHQTMPSVHNAPLGIRGIFGNTVTPNIKSTTQGLSMPRGPQHPANLNFTSPMFPITHATLNATGGSNVLSNAPTRNETALEKLVKLQKCYNWLLTWHPCLQTLKNSTAVNSKECRQFRANFTKGIHGLKTNALETQQEKLEIILRNVKG